MSRSVKMPTSSPSITRDCADVLEAHHLGGLGDGRLRLDRHEGGAHHVAKHIHASDPA